MDFKDYYKIMGVERDASQDEIKKAYRKLARKYHPDVSKAADAEVRFKEVGEAYEVLKDPEKRTAYDQLGADWKAGQEFHPPPGCGYCARCPHAMKICEEHSPDVFVMSDTHSSRCWLHHDTATVRVPRLHYRGAGA